MVPDGRQAQGQTEWSGRRAQRVKTRRARKRETGKSRSWEQKCWLTWQTRRTGNGQTEKTGIYTQGIMGKMGDTWRGWRQSQGQVKQIRVWHPRQRKIDVGLTEMSEIQNNSLSYFSTTGGCWEEDGSQQWLERSQWNGIKHMETMLDVFDTIPLIPLQPLPRTRPPKLRRQQPPVISTLTVTINENSGVLGLWYGYAPRVPAIFSVSSNGT